MGHELELFIGFSNESTRNRMFWFADLNRISDQAIVIIALDLLCTHVKTHKLLQTCKQVVTSLFTSCSQDVFALLVPNLLEQVWNKLLTNCNKLGGTIRPVTRLF